MYCQECGNEITNLIKYCPECGNRISTKQIGYEQTEFSRTFIAPGLFFPDPFSIANEMNDWFTKSTKISYVRMNLHIDNGVTRQITITFTESNKYVPFRFGIAVIKFSILQIIRRLRADQYINQWIKENPLATIVTQRVVTYNSAPSQIWILYKYSKD